MKYVIGQYVAHKKATSLTFKIIDICPSMKKKSEDLYVCELIDGSYKEIPPTGWMTAEELSDELVINEVINEINSKNKNIAHKHLCLINNYHESDLIIIDNKN